MDLQLTGKIVQVLEEQSGESKNGKWRKQDYILESGGNYPKKVCLTVWGDNIDEFAISQNDEITANIDIQSREFNGRWYTDVKAWRVEKSGQAGQSARGGTQNQGGSQNRPGPGHSGENPPPPEDKNAGDFPPDDEDDSLPF